MADRAPRPAIKTRTAAALVLGLVAVLSPTGNAQPILIDFESIPGMTNSPGLQIPQASRLSDQYLMQHGVRFASGAPFVAVVVHGSGTPSGVNIIGGATSSGSLTYSPSTPLIASFFDSTGTQRRVVSQVSVRGDLFSIPGTKTLEALNLSGGVIQSVTLNDSNTEPLLITAPGIHAVRMFSSSATVGFDDLRFTTPIPPCPDLNNDAVVNTSDLVLFLAAFGQTPSPGSPQSVADLNADGTINTADLILLLAAFGQSCA